MNILIVNDDSIHAPGIAVLAKAAAEIGDVWVVAPSDQCSCMSQKVTFGPKLTAKKVVDFPAPVKAAWEVDGTPVDCVKVAILNLLQFKPDLVLSGINNGYNAGYDIAYSGTLGATFEALRNGIPAIAFSISSQTQLPAVDEWLLPILRELAQKQIEEGMVWNVNFPPVKNSPPLGILWDRIPARAPMYYDCYDEEIQPDGSILLSCRGIPVKDEDLAPGSDGEALRKGYISIGKVRAF